VNDQPKITTVLGEAFLGAIRQALRDELQAAGIQNGAADSDRLMDAKEAALLLSVSEDWLYRNAKKLPFARKLGPKMLRFSAVGIQKYVSSKKA
jgi:predicted DNA-binding transcriptional regulator AlpA